MSALAELVENALAVAGREPSDADPAHVAMTLVEDSPTGRAIWALVNDSAASPAVRALAYYGGLADAYCRGIGTGRRSLAQRLAEARASAEENRRWLEGLYGFETAAAIVDGFGVRAEVLA